MRSLQAPQPAARYLHAHSQEHLHERALAHKVRALGMVPAQRAPRPALRNASALHESQRLTNCVPSTLTLTPLACCSLCWLLLAVLPRAVHEPICP
jgi:hypothetical protein